MTHERDGKDHANHTPMEIARVDRRCFLLFSAATLLGGCNQSNKAVSELPEVPWPERGYEMPQPRVASTGSPTTADPASEPGGAVDSSLVPGMIPRRMWTRGTPVYSQMNRMAPIRYITVHHDGMRPFTDDSESGAKHRIELIRRAHLGRGWADIGYHFVVDRGGRIYEARPVSWQGAHVKDHNPGNIGVMALGNFDEQSPTSAQVEGVRRAVSALMAHYRVPVARLRTHQEWAATACPGRNMQAQVNRLRHGGWV